VTTALIIYKEKNMHSKQIQAEIHHLMETLQEQYEVVNNRQGKIPRIELDLMMTTLRNLYEQLHRLGLRQDSITSQQEPVTESAAVISPVMLTPDIKADEHQIIEFAAAVPQPAHSVLETLVTTIIEETAEIKEEVKIRPEPVVFKEEIPAPVKMEKQTTAPAKKQVQTAGLFDEVTTVAQTYSVKTTLHDKMSSGKTDRSVADHLQSKPLTDLKKSIGINEKFVFVNELFEGNHNLFNQSIERLNGFTAYEQARRHLFEELAGQMNWNMESKAFNELSDLVRRRFTSL
jgi:hypothetical protein